MYAREAYSVLAAGLLSVSTQRHGRALPRTGRESSEVSTKPAWPGGWTFEIRLGFSAAPLPGASPGLRRSGPTPWLARAPCRSRGRCHVRPALVAGHSGACTDLCTDP